MRSNRTLDKKGKPGARSKASVPRRTRRRSATTRPVEGTTSQRLIEAALTSLRLNGFQGTTARAIARAGEVNQALIFYHFGSVDRLLLAAVEAMSTERLARYRVALERVTTLSMLLETMAHLYDEDVRIGHVTAVQELVAGSAGVPGLREEVIAQVEPWVTFAEEVVARLVKGTFLQGLMPLHDVAYILCALYFGMEMLTHLNKDDRSRVEALFKMGTELAPLADAMLASATWSGEKP